MSFYNPEWGRNKIEILEPPVSSSVPMLEGMIHRVEELSGSLAQEATSAAVRVKADLLMSQSVEKVVYHVAAAAKMSTTKDTFELIRGGIAPRNLALELDDEGEDEVSMNVPEKNGEVEDERYWDEGYDDDGKTDATTQVGLKDLPKQRRAIAGPSTAIPTSTTPAQDPASSLPLYVPPSSAPAQAPAPFGLGISYPTPVVPTPMVPSQYSPTQNNYYPGWHSFNPTALTPPMPGQSCLCPGCTSPYTINPSPSPTPPAVPSYPDQFFLSEDTYGQVFMAPITGESNAPMINIPRQGRPVKMRGSYVARVPQQNYMIENGVYTMQSQSPPGESRVRYPAWSAPVVGKGKKRAYGEMSEG